MSLNHKLASVSVFSSSVVRLRQAICVLCLLAAMSPSMSKALTVDEFNDGTNSWTYARLTFNSESMGTLNLTRTGADPYLRRSDFLQYVEGGANPYIHVRMRKDVALSAISQIFW